MQEALTQHLEQHDHASSQSSMNQLLFLPNHDKWVLAHQGFVAKTSATHLLGNLLVVCAAERLSSQDGRVLKSTSPLLVKQMSCRRIFTLVVFDEDAYMRQVNACRVSSPACNIPRLAEVDECVHDVFVFSQLFQWSCLSTPRERAHGITTSEGVKSK